MSRRIAAWLALPLLALAACGGRAATAERAAPTGTWKPAACNPGQHQSTPEAYYDCVNGAWKPGTAPTPPTTAPPATAPPTTAPPTTEAPTTVPPTTQPVPTTTPPPPPPGPEPTINITCPTPQKSGNDSLRADFGYDFHATTPALVRWGIEYGDGRSYTADDEAKARTQVFWHRYHSPGTYTVTAWVEDAIGRRASGSCQFTWTQPPPPPPPTRPPTPQPEIVPDPPYLFGQTADGEPIRWPACTAMHWSYNPAGEPSPGVIDVVRAAVAQISAASGVEMIEDGVTSIDVSDPDQAFLQIADGEVVVGWVSPESAAIQRVDGGDPDNTWATAPNWWMGPDITKGSVAIKRDAAVMKLPLDFSSSDSLGALVLHEIGHIVGLQHVGPSTQIMGVGNPQPSPGHLGTGDLAGLATLKNRPCDAAIETSTSTTPPPPASTIPEQQL